MMKKEKFVKNANIMMIEREIKMEDNFTVSKKIKETKSGTTIIIDIKKSKENPTTISGDIEDVVEEL